MAALADCATDKSINNNDVVRRCLAGEQPGENVPAPKQVSWLSPIEVKLLKYFLFCEQSSNAREGKAEAPSKAENPPTETSRNRDVQKSEEKNENLIEVDSKRAPDFDAPLDRGKSRSGTRGGKPSQSTGGAGLSGLNNRPPTLDAEIEKCDGSFEATRTILGAVIQRPKLTDKLLAKPPFRFLHDIVMEVMKATGFATDLYDAEDMDSANVKEKSEKILFLEKIVKVVGVQLNTIVEARPAKIVAGLEPQNTNVFLQLLGVAASMMPESSNAVRIVREQLAGSTGGGDDEPAPVVAPAPAPAPARVEEKAKAEEKSTRSKQVAFQFIYFLRVLCLNKPTVSLGSGGSCTCSRRNK